MRCLGVPTATSAGLKREFPCPGLARVAWPITPPLRSEPRSLHRERNWVPCVARREQAVLLWAWCLLLSVDDEIDRFPVWVHQGRSDVWQGCPVEDMNLLCHEVELACAGESPWFSLHQKELDQQEAEVLEDRRILLSRQYSSLWDAEIMPVPCGLSRQRSG